MNNPADEDLTGQQFGNYEIRSRLGSGGMGDVYVGYYRSLNVNTAVKVLNKALRGDERVRERFKREAQTAANLRHQNIVRVHVFDEHISADNQSIPYIGMDLLQGGSLADRIEENEKKGTAFQLLRVADILDQVADGLFYAHKNGVIHRDIKPNNILFLRDEVDSPPIIVDFGIVKLLDQESLTRRTEILGTPTYMAPEQLENSPTRPLDGAADQYALACTVYKMLTGQPPFIENPLIEHLRVLPKPVHEVREDLRLPPALSDVLGQALAKYPRDRYSSVVEFAEAFRAAIPQSGRSPNRVVAPIPEATLIEQSPPARNEPSLPGPTVPPTKGTKHPPQRRTPSFALAIGAMAVIVLVLFAAIAFVSNQNEINRIAMQSTGTAQAQAIALAIEQTSTANAATALARIPTSTLTETSTDVPSLTPTLTETSTAAPSLTPTETSTDVPSLTPTLTETSTAVPSPTLNQTETSTSSTALMLSQMAPDEALAALGIDAEDGTYIAEVDQISITHNQENGVWGSGNLIDYAVGDFVLHADVVFRSPGSECTIDFRWNDLGGGVYGMYKLGINDRANIHFRIPPELTQQELTVPQILTGLDEPNQVFLVVRDGIFSLYINDLSEPSAVFNGEQYASGLINLASANYSEANAAACGFNNLWVWQPVGAPLADALVAMTVSMAGNWEQDAQIHKLDTRTGQRIQLTTCARNWDAAWSPDGSRLAFVSTCNENNNNPSGDHEIWLMNADGSNKTQLTKTDSSEAVPVWSPDGTQLVYVIWTSDTTKHDLWLIDVNSGNAQPLAAANSSESETYPSWSPDGKWIAFSALEGATVRLCFIAADGSGTRSCPIEQGNPEDIWWLRRSNWTADSQSIIYRVVQEGVVDSLFMSDLAGENPRLLNSANGYVFPALSRDGSTLFYTFGQDGEDRIFRMRTNGSYREQISNGPGEEWDPAFFEVP